METIEQVAALTEVDEHLQFAIEVIECLNLPEFVQVELGQHIKRIQKRRTDPSLYLAVIGEFSSGKSTFINALLRDDLLKTSALVATVTSTILLHGSELKVEVRFKDPQKVPLKVNSKSKQITVLGLPGVDDLNIRQFIHAVTSNDKVTQNVLNVTIAHPTLTDGIVIIDTPGTNAVNSEHGAITRQIVENEADAAVVIIPATVPLPQTLVNFLAGSLRPYLHRCIFVVTRMDQIPQDEQSDLLINLRSRLVSRLGIKPPVLYTCAAQVVIDSLSGEEAISKDNLVWKERFSKLEGIIINCLRTQRSISIAENLIRLLTQLFEQLNQQLLEQWKHYETRRVVIKQEMIPDLTEFAAQQHTICHQLLKEPIANTLFAITRCIEEQRKETIAKIHSAIFNAETETALNSVVQTQAEKILKTSRESMQKEMQPKFEIFSQLVKDIDCQFDQKFTSAYRRLQVIGGQIETDSGAVSRNMDLNVSDVFSAMQSMTKDIDGKDGSIAAGGITAGAIIGNMMLPGLGIFLGGFIGLCAAGLFISLDVRKQKLWEKLQPSLDAYFNAQQRAVQQAMQNYANSVVAALKARINTRVTRYQAIADAMLNEQNTELQRLNQLQASTQRYLSEINRRRNSLLLQQQRLAAVVEIK